MSLSQTQLGMIQGFTATFFSRPCSAVPWFNWGLTQVQEWKLKCEAIEKRENERREAEAKKHKVRLGTQAAPRVIQN
jgi:hypothetical protein